MRHPLFAALACILMFAGGMYADTITPDSLTRTIAVGETINISKLVTITQMVTSPVDVFFLADTTGSMGGAIGTVRTNASSILSAVTVVSPTVQFGVGEYKDFGDAYAYRLNQAMTASPSAVQTGINMWSAGGGGDYQEADLYALNRAATDAGTGWRTDSRRFLVWMGDASGHDPSGGITEGMATSALTGNHIATYPINVGTMNDTGQAGRIATATGGMLSTNPADVTAAIISAISTALINYSTVDLAIVPLTPGLTFSFVPPSYNGTYDRSIDRAFAFDLGITGATPGIYNFAVVARVDGSIVAREIDSITVGEVPEPATFALLGAGLTVLALARRRKS